MEVVGEGGEGVVGFGKLTKKGLTLLFLKDWEQKYAEKK